MQHITLVHQPTPTIPSQDTPRLFQLGIKDTATHQSAINKNQESFVNPLPSPSLCLFYAIVTLRGLSLFFTSITTTARFKPPLYLGLQQNLMSLPALSPTPYSPFDQKQPLLKCKKYPISLHKAHQQLPTALTKSPDFPGCQAPMHLGNLSFSMSHLPSRLTICSFHTSNSCPSSGFCTGSSFILECSFPVILMTCSCSLFIIKFKSYFLQEVFP